MDDNKRWLPCWISRKAHGATSIKLVDSDKDIVVSHHRLIPYDRNKIADKASGEFGKGQFPFTQSQIWKSDFATDIYLVTKAEKLCKEGLADGTRVTYFNKCKNFIKWGLARANKNPLQSPVSENDIILFVTDRAGKVSVETIESDFAAIRNYHLERGWDFPYHNRSIHWPLLTRVLKGVQKTYGKKKKDQRQAFTTQMFEQIFKSFWNKDFNKLAIFSNYKYYVLWFTENQGGSK